MNELQKTQFRIAENVRQQRQLKRWSQKQLAKEIGVSQAHVSAIENMRCESLSLDTLHSLAKVFNLPFSCILGTSDAMLYRENKNLHEWSDFLREQLSIRLKKREVK